MLIEKNEKENSLVLRLFGSVSNFPFPSWAIYLLSVTYWVLFMHVMTFRLWPQICDPLLDRNYSFNSLFSLTAPAPSVFGDTVGCKCSKETNRHIRLATSVLERASCCSSGVIQGSSLFRIDNLCYQNSCRWTIMDKAFKSN